MSFSLQRAVESMRWLSTSEDVHMLVADRKLPNVLPHVYPRVGHPEFPCTTHRPVSNNEVLNARCIVFAVACKLDHDHIEVTRIGIGKHQGLSALNIKAQELHGSTAATGSELSKSSSAARCHRCLGSALV